MKYINGVNMKPHYPWIIILLGALLIVVAGCNQTPEESEDFKVEVKCLPDYKNDPQYIIRVFGKRYYTYEPIKEYYPISNITNAWFMYDRDYAIALAKHFNSFEKVQHWNDSVEALRTPAPTPKPICDETIKIY